MLRRRTLLVALLVTLFVSAAACSSAGSDEAAPATTDEPAAAPSARVCDQGASSETVDARPVDGVDSDHDLTSFDGTEIRLHWFPVEGASGDDPAPTVLMGPGWSLPGDTSTDGAALFSAASIAGLWDHGYNVLTWDPRGFGESGGIASVNDPDVEGRDVQALLDFVADQPEAALDGDGDPTSGMVGLSYGGGIQLTTASIDCRVDAIVPGIAWSSLETSLYKAETVKVGWARILTSTVDPERLDPHIVSATEAGLGGGQLSDEDLDWFRDRGPGDAVDDITAPTLLVGGTVDALFTLQESLTVYDALAANEVPVAMVWFCGGHGTCVTDPGDEGRIAESTFAWLDRYVKGDEDAPELPALDLIDQDGTRWTIDEWPTPAADEGALTAEATDLGPLALTEASAPGAITVPEDSDDLLAGIVSAITPTPADEALEVTIGPTDDEVLVVGAPSLEMTYRGTLPDGETDGRLFALLVDDEGEVVVGNQITPIAVTLDGEPHTVAVDLEVVAQRLDPGETLTLQLVATAAAYATPPLGGELTVEELTVSLPVPTDVEAG